MILSCSLFAQVVTSPAAAGPSATEVLHEANTTRLFALETRLAILASRNKLTLKEKAWLAPLKTGHARSYRRVRVSNHYVPKQGSSRCNQPNRVKIESIVAARARLYGIHPEFVHAIIKCESNYDDRAISRAGAMGLMQLMPETAADLGVVNPWSPEENIDGGIRYIVALLKEFRDPWKALVSYNCGPEILRKGLPVPAESRRYAGRVLRLFTRRHSANAR